MIHVIGHASEKPSSAEDKKLSGLRAHVVADLLKQQGIAPERVDNKGVGRILYAPINKDETDTFRRVEIMIEARHGIYPA
ncbi:MAG: OmpA family protein [Mariprofundaceae bacterium]|nr:OmpA family protein [Mariprofundaceae bacterium]